MQVEKGPHGSKNAVGTHAHVSNAKRLNYSEMLVVGSGGNPKVQISHHTQRIATLGNHNNVPVLSVANPGFSRRGRQSLPGRGGEGGGGVLHTIWSVFPENCLK